MEDIYGTSFTSMNSIIASSTSLEHFHLYSKPSSQQDTTTTTTIATHTDAGLFLSFVPAQSCSSSSQKDDDDAAFYVEIDGVLQQATFPKNSVIIMLGSGMQHWIHLNKEIDLSFKATKHAVKMNGLSASRAWYGMMHLVPPDAIIQRHPTIQTFNNMRSSMSLSSRQASSSFQDNNVISIGCGNHPSPQSSHLNNDLSEVTTTSVHRRLQHVSGPEACNNVTQFMCWLICLDIPDHENAVSRLREGESLYCLNPSVYAKSGGSVVQATQPCTDDKGIMGNVMNDACMGSWLPSSAFVKGYALERDGVNIADLTDEERMHNMEDHYCHGGTSMYMDGFNWQGTTCVIYLFQSWVLSTQGQFIAACIGTVLVSVFLEFVISSRRTLLPKVPVGWKRLASSTVLYGTQITLGYFVMLVVMTYSGPLFLCVVIGLMIGHVGTNHKRLLESSSSPSSSSGEDVIPPSDGITPCCQYDVGTEGKENTGTAASSSQDENSSGDLFLDEEGKGASECC